MTEDEMAGWHHRLDGHEFEHVRGRDTQMYIQGIFPTQGLNLSLTSPTLAGSFFTIKATWEALGIAYIHKMFGLDIIQ